MNKVNTFLIGAQKAGTTSLYDWLGQHPEINAPSVIKDYHFFTNDELFKKGITHFNSFYKKNNRCPVNLHAAVNYLFFNEIAVKRITEYNPDSKIIICLRNPQDRAISAFKYFKRTAREKYNFDTALSRELNGKLSHHELSNNSYILHGKYSAQIEVFMNYFKREQVHFVLFEELMDKRLRNNILKDICDFLNIDSNIKFQFTHLNKSATPRINFINKLVRENQTIKSFKFLLPFQIRRRLFKKIEELNISKKDIEVEISNQAIKILSTNLGEEREKIGQIIQRDLSKIWGK
ncbi:sulfotransferase [uncultured Draconibacterium sp.]|uniref:sulfotransferase family protein n=1 Tax=uncultured Draconibacterium sp. TaxID=1573823 RepID=UPI003216F0FD